MFACLLGVVIVGCWFLCYIIVLLWFLLFLCCLFIYYCFPIDFAWLLLFSWFTLCLLCRCCDLRLWLDCCFCVVGIVAAWCFGLVVVGCVGCLWWLKVVVLPWVCLFDVGWFIVWLIVLLLLLVCYLWGSFVLLDCVFMSLQFVCGCFILWGVGCCVAKFCWLLLCGWLLIWLLAKVGVVWVYDLFRRFGCLC